ncbi:MAG: pyruvate ferredoxin oxidoreductase [Dehalococcoidia bacterium]|nr:MAG: pyruvate ferredoxin oxidoreductase [Dehalococcoidia bacterium]
MPKVKERDKSCDHLFASGHTACPGCGQSLAVRLVLRAAGRNVIVVNSTGCLEIFSSKYGESSWEVPYIHSLFENIAAVASGVESALKATGRLDDVRVIAMGGDGATADIGFGAISGMMERGHDVLYICYDNEAYMNTGIQRSGCTPHYARTTTSPPGKASLGNWRPKKDLPQIILAHGVPYVATATVGYYADLDKKVKRALSIRGPKYIQVHVPCPLGWGSDSSRTIELAKIAANSGLFPLYEVDHGELKVRRIGKKIPVEEYLNMQVRFRHLFGKDGARAEVDEIQAVADANIEKYGLMAK